MSASHSAPRPGSNSEVRYDPDPDRALTIPAHYYYDKDVFEREKRNIFYNSWVFAGFVDDVAKPGDFITATVIDQPVFVIRDKEGQLRAFYNVCQHRGHLLLSGNGSAKRITCPFHSWSYDLEGALVSAPNEENVPNFCRGDFSLSEVRVEEFCRMLFVNLAPGSGSFAETVPGLKEQIYGVVPELDTLFHAAKDEISIDANWKMIFDGLECYHCPFIHPGVMNSKDDYMTKEITSQDFDNFSWHVFHGNREVIDGRNGHTPPEWADRVDSYDLNLWYVWPNLMIMSHPGRANLKVAHAWPQSPDHTIRYIDHFLTSPEPSAQDRAQMARHREVFDQDIEAMLSQQAGMKSLGYRQGRLMVDEARSWRSEHSTHHFQGMVWRALNPA